MGRKLIDGAGADKENEGICAVQCLRLIAGFCFQNFHDVTIKRLCFVLIWH
jgi:hypothetical protein